MKHVLRDQSVAGARVNPIIVVGMILLLAGCGGGEKNDQASRDTGGKTPTLDACALLTSAGAAAILEEPGTLKSVVQASEEKRAVSQCVYFSKSSPRSIGLLVRYGALDQNPRTREAFIEKTRGENTMGMGEETAEALRKGTEIPGIGDLAVSYELFGTNLYVLWDDHYQMVITMSGFKDNAGALKNATDIARSVLEHL
jgi:hypothetical protein